MVSKDLLLRGTFSEYIIVKFFIIIEFGCAKLKFCLMEYTYEILYFIKD